MARTKKSADPMATRFAQLEAAAKDIKGFQPAHDVLTAVKAMPTPFPQFDVATGIGGLPLQRVILAHGPSSHGKSILAHGFGGAFLRSGNFYHLVDAEFTTVGDWMDSLLFQWSKTPGFSALRPKTYEQTADSVRSACETMANARVKGQLPDDITALFVVDSIRKLNPENLMANIAKDKGGVDGAGGRAAQMKAAKNAQWMDELVPLMYHANATMLLIGRESENPDAGMYDKKWKLQGGKAIFYDSSLVMRITRREWLKMSQSGPIVGERHQIEIHKTKVAAKDGKSTLCDFYTSNGSQFAPGYLRAMDVFEMAKECGVLKKKGQQYQWTSTGELFPKHKAGTVRYLADNPKTLEAVEEEARDGFTPEEHDQAGGSDDDELIEAR